MSEPFVNLTLDRPLAVIDTETTGVDPKSDRIVEVAAVRLATGWETLRYCRVINPGVPIPPAATAVHGLADADVADKPRFRAIARRLAQVLEGCDLAGFNLRRFDLPFLVAEFARVGVDFSPCDRGVIDVMQLFHAKEPRDLAAALRLYCGREHAEAHGALADALATAAILDSQVAHYEDLPRTIMGLHELLTDVDVGGRFRAEGDRVVFAFGKHLSKPLDEVARLDPGYLRWMLDQDFFDDAKRLVERALARRTSGV